MEHLGVSYFPFYPRQMILQLCMYKQFYMSTVDFSRRNLLKRKPRTLKPLRRLDVLLYLSLPGFQRKKYFSCSLLSKIDMDDELFSSYL